MISQQRGRKKDWKSPFEWTDEEVHDLCMREIGSDDTFATGFKLLLKLWVPPEMKGGVYIPETMRSNDISVVGMIIGMGGDAFMDPYRFPTGPTHTYGEWAIFRPYEDQKIKVNGNHLVTFISDERLVGSSVNVDTIKSALKLEEEHKFVGG